MNRHQRDKILSRESGLDIRTGPLFLADRLWELTEMAIYFAEKDDLDSRDHLPRILKTVNLLANDLSQELRIRNDARLARKAREAERRARS